MSEKRIERKLAAIMSADIAGYSRLMGADEEGTLAAVKKVRQELADPIIAEHRGRIVKTTGDGLLVEFASVVDAMRCATLLQRAMAEANAGTPSNRRIDFRIGIHHGDIIIDEGDIFGDGVNLAARLEGLAKPGGICVSRVVHDEVRDKLGVAFDDLGEQIVKNIARPVQAFAVRLEAKASKPSSSESLALPEKPSLAVLPFQNMSGDPEQEYFADGMVEEITTAIARLPWLFVIARNSSFTFKGRAIDVKQIARELGVRYVLEGSVRKSGMRVRITGQLIDTTTSAHIWADHFDGALDDVFELQDRVASSVAGAIEPRLRQSEIARAARKPTESLDAYDLYLRAMAESKFTAKGTGAAVDFLHRALALDAGCSPAAAMLAWCRARQRAIGLIRLGDAEIAEGVSLARQAISGARDDGDALWMAGLAIWSLASDRGAAEAAVDRAIALNPNCAHAWNAKGMICGAFSRFDDAVDAAKRAMRLSPLDPNSYYFKYSLLLACFGVGRFADAMEWADQVLQEQPDFLPAIRFKSALCGHLGMRPVDRAWIDQMTRQDASVWNQGHFLSSAFSAEFQAHYREGRCKAGLKAA